MNLPLNNNNNNNDDDDDDNDTTTTTTTTTTTAAAAAAATTTNNNNNNNNKSTSIKQTNLYILLTKREGRTGRISARGFDSTDRAQRGPYKKDRGPIFSQHGPEQVWLIRDLLHD